MKIKEFLSEDSKQAKIKELQQTIDQIRKRVEKIEKSSATQYSNNPKGDYTKQVRAGNTAFTARMLRKSLSQYESRLKELQDEN